MSGLGRRGKLLFVGALSLLVHAKGLRAPLLDYHFHRQVNTASIARNYWRENRPLLRPRIDWDGPEDRLAATEFPAEMWLMGRLWPMFGLGEIWGRVLSVLASALTALMLFLLLEREFGGESAFYGAALFTVLPVEMYFGRNVQPEAAALLGFVSALYFWDLSLEPGRPFGPWLAAVVSAFFAAGLKLPYAHVLLPLGALSWRRLGRAALADGRTWAAGLVAMGGVAAWYVYASSGTFVVPAHENEFVRFLAYAKLPYYAQFLTFSRFPELVTTYAGLLFFFFGAREVLARRRDPFWIALFGGTFLHLVALGKYAHAHEYSCLPLTLGAAGLIGEGVRILREKAYSFPEPRKSRAAFGLALLLAAVPLHAALRVRRWYHQGYEYLARAHEAADAVSAKGDLFVTNSAPTSVALYYLDRRGWSDDFGLYSPDQLTSYLNDKKQRGARFVVSEKKALLAGDGALWRQLGAKSAPVWDDGALVIFPLDANGGARTGSSASDYR